MGKPSRDKGCRSERNLVAVFKAYGIPAKRVPLSGAATGFKGDVLIEVAGRQMQLESKVRATGFKQIYGWIEGNDALVIKADRQESLVVVPLQLFCELMGGKIDVD